MTSSLELLTTIEMARADQLAVESGVPSLTLMENAGRAVADEAMKMISPGGRIAVLCGPGNNGGDGFVAARILKERGYEVRVACLVARDQLKGDAAEMARRWTGEVESRPELRREMATGNPQHSTLAVHETPAFLSETELIIDALLGAGLDRPLTGAVRDWVLRINGLAGRHSSPIPILAVDVPTGLNGDTGTIASPNASDAIDPGGVVWATRTVTFFRRKPGHVLLPGRQFCGEVVVADIGIPDEVLETLEPATFANAPGLWRGFTPRGLSTTITDTHKYWRGHSVVVSGPAHRTGAARLAARGALRVGAGLVTVASPIDAIAVHAAHLTAIMIAPFDGAAGLNAILTDPRIRAVLIGPACGVGAQTRETVTAILATPKAVVLDADALTSFEADPQEVFDRIKSRNTEPHCRVVMTPHEGEFARLFPDLKGSKLERARVAAERSGAVIVLKGPDTVIAAPAGVSQDHDVAAINENAPPTLATAGSGDVLAGFITGLLAQRMPAWEAACASVWLHGECANTFGPGLIAEDLPEMLPKVLAALK